MLVAVYYSEVKQQVVYTGPGRKVMQRYSTEDMDGEYGQPTQQTLLTAAAAKKVLQSPLY